MEKREALCKKIAYCTTLPSISPMLSQNDDNPRAYGPEQPAIVRLDAASEANARSQPYHISYL